VGAEHERWPWGLCLPPPTSAVAEVLARAGFSYYEPTVAHDLMAEAEWPAAPDLARWRPADLAPRAVNVLLPASLRVVGPERDLVRLRDYLTEAMRRARVLGVETVVFGSGGARRIPEGYPGDAARRELGEALRLAAAAADPGIRVCLEHLRRAETNLVNALDDARQLLDDLQEPRLALVVDAYHLQEEHESPTVIRACAAAVAHVHVCGAQRRPPEAGDVDWLARVLTELAAIGYGGKVSIECRLTDPAEEAPRALDNLRQAARLAGVE
jgi:D-psicose/D-tagatose/L-ribulose 3-epimerase